VCFSHHNSFVFTFISQTEKSLFQLQAERLLSLMNLAKIHASHSHSHSYTDTEIEERVRIPWYIMTNEASDIKIREYFRINKYFGLTESDVLFFQQQSQPSYSPSGLLFVCF
jgi:UDP-N-acetylglucosamine/UDP-N-acetylgalactosamine diphosphorylase